MLTTEDAENHGEARRGAPFADPRSYPEQAHGHRVPCWRTGGKLHHGVRQQPRGPHPHGEKMAAFHGFERTTASIYMVDTEAQRYSLSFKKKSLFMEGESSVSLW